MKSHPIAAATLAALALTACSDGQPPATTQSPAVAPPASSTPTQVPASVPPLGKDISCFDHDHCYLRNPDKLSDEQLRAHFATVQGADQPPAASMRPWAYVVLGLGEQRITAVDAPREGAAAVGDEIGVLNHRALFAYCRSDDGHWLQIEPITAQPPGQVWIAAEHLVPYGHDGHIPSC